MNSFDFINPTHIVFGLDRIGELDKLVPADSKVLVIYGGGSAEKYGTLGKVREALGARTVLEFGGVEPNPHYETLVKAAAIAKDEAVDMLIAVGGGSVIDGTKFVSLAAKFAGDPMEILLKGFSGPPVTEALPIGAVLTLPATGSEMNMGAVISYGDGKFPVMSPLTYPKFSILDPGVTKTLPKTQVANGIIDAFVHVTEQYVTFPAGGHLQDRWAEGILQTLVEVGPKTLADPDDMEARASFMWSATMALNGIIAVGVPVDWSTHMIGHELTALFGIDHGKTLAIIQPAAWKILRDQKRQKLLQYAERVWGITDGSEDERIDGAIAKTEAFFQGLGIGTRLGDYDIGADDIDRVVANLEKHHMTALSETGAVTLEVSRAILTEAL